MVVGELRLVVGIGRARWGLAGRTLQLPEVASLAWLVYDRISEEMIVLL